MRMTGGRQHRLDATNASRTLLFNIHTQDWDEDLLELFDTCPLLPEVLIFGGLRGEWADCGIRGQRVMGMAGTSTQRYSVRPASNRAWPRVPTVLAAFLVMNTGEEPILQHRMPPPWPTANGKPTYALEGSIFIAGAAIQWLRDGLKLIDVADESEDHAIEIPQDHGVYLVPAFTGLGAPYWDPEARGAIFGLTRNTGIREIVTAGLQSVVPDQGPESHGEGWQAP